ncbi:GTPase HflX [Lujinxingia litoralis]|uniref:GTPase HflX n=1 Tax=Lujinxingia litoralis TaxID=2211119 RepID=UPI001314242F|nr:GTPase HflX [Lujinxingia litoralis]
MRDSESNNASSEHPHTHDTRTLMGHRQERAVILSVQTPELDDQELESSARELTALARTLGMEVLAGHAQKRTNDRSVALLGRGKLEEVRADCESLGLNLALVDAELSPRQQQVLEEALGIGVMDRSAVILRIFEERAQTREARLQVEMARISYELPRVRTNLVGDDRHGGGGRGGRGHSNTELARQRYRERLVELQQELAEVQARARLQRERRSQAFQVALVGYTNAGKSSLMRALTGSQVLVEDKLFATLGTTARRLEPQLQPEVVISDTVGFIKRLPHELVASFKSTLDEARDADLLLFVLDASDPAWPEHLRVTRETLRSIDVDLKDALVVFNKVDCLEHEARASLRIHMPDALQVSAMKPELLSLLHQRIARAQEASFVEESLFIPYESGQLVGSVHRGARVMEQHHGPHGTGLRVKAPAHSLNLWRDELGGFVPVEEPEELLAHCEALGLELLSESERFEESGADYRALHASDLEERPWVVRSPRRQGLMEASRYEARALRALRGELPVATPEWALHSARAIAYPRLPGRPAWEITDQGELRWPVLNPAAPTEAFLSSVVGLLSALHHLEPGPLMRAGLRRQGPEQERKHLHSQLLRVLPMLKPSQALRERWERWLADDTLWAWEPVPVHGDLHPGHLLLDEQARVVGVIDWSEVHLGDPAIDLVFLVDRFGPQVLVDVLERLDDAGAAGGPRLEVRCRERGAFQAVIVADWALTHGHELARAYAFSLVEAAESQMSET